MATSEVVVADWMLAMHTGSSAPFVTQTHCCVGRWSSRRERTIVADLTLEQIYFSKKKRNHQPGMSQKIHGGGGGGGGEGGCCNCDQRVLFFFWRWPVVYCHLCSWRMKEADDCSESISSDEFGLNDFSARSPPNHGETLVAGIACSDSISSDEFGLAECPASPLFPLGNGHKAQSCLPTCTRR